LTRNIHDKRQFFKAIFLIQYFWRLYFFTIPELIYEQDYYEA